MVTAKLILSDWCTFVLPNMQNTRSSASPENGDLNYFDGMASLRHRRQRRLLLCSRMQQHPPICCRGVGDACAHPIVNVHACATRRSYGPYGIAGIYLLICRHRIKSPRYKAQANIPLGCKATNRSRTHALAACQVTIAVAVWRGWVFIDCCCDRILKVATR